MKERERNGGNGEERKGKEREGMVRGERGKRYGMGEGRKER